MTEYAKDKRFEIPSAFTALNGAAQTFEVVANVALAYKPADDSDAELIKAEVAQRNLLRVLEVLRSNGAQPIITSVVGDKVTFTVEQTWVHGVRGDMQVSARKGGENEFASLEAGAEHDIKVIFGKAKAVEYDAEKKVFKSSETVNLFKSAKVLSTIGSLV